ncbi:hypothetical protein Pyrfu_1646 [Pyrolobus fumarii 1A]|uniref:Uncharacterized protein n=1 Tax=Pyrolobus fumarii (strain DSM 11204 / 1A) TaxID=694429 RepID=G0ECD2_PYRF1|nr:hypothetical protein [Pyrolobus fumarii]AEM39502.1 hypothetical protein Pyrfu_1646 [Pyrolobus fumarii 1A]
MTLEISARDKRLQIAFLLMTLPLVIMGDTILRLLSIIALSSGLVAFVLVERVEES